MRKEMKKKIHINQHNIRHNAKHADKKPVITCKTYKSNTYANELEILDREGNVACRVVYSPDKPLSCGAKVWIETDNDIRIELGDFLDNNPEYQ